MEKPENFATWQRTVEMLLDKYFSLIYPTGLDASVDTRNASYSTPDHESSEFITGKNLSSYKMRVLFEDMFPDQLDRLDLRLVSVTFQKNRNGKVVEQKISILDVCRQIAERIQEEEMTIGLMATPLFRHLPDSDDADSEVSEPEMSEIEPGSEQKLNFDDFCGELLGFTHHERKVRSENELADALEKAIQQLDIVEIDDSGYIPFKNSYVSGGLKCSSCNRDKELSFGLKFKRIYLDVAFDNVFVRITINSPENAYVSIGEWPANGHTSVNTNSFMTAMSEAISSIFEKKS